MSEEDSLRQISDRIQALSTSLNGLQESRDRITIDIEKKTTGRIKKWLSFWVGGGILSLVIMYVSIFRLVTTKSADHIANSLRDKFSEPKIVETLTSVAENQARQIIESNLNPAIESATSAVDQEIDSFEADLREF